jgi:hypothetical protein
MRHLQLIMTSIYVICPIYFLQIFLYNNINFYTFQLIFFNFTAYIKEVNDWLNSTECSDVFQSMKKKLISVIEETLHLRNSSTGNDTIYVYLAADNQQVKEAFAAEIVKDENQGFFGFSMNLMTVDTKFVHHIKHLATMKSATNDEGKCMYEHTYVHTISRTVDS